jgi:cell division protein FtsZ
MKGGGVAILGSASAEGENRAQEAIENALTSPLLNDNEIKGAKWILININSAEGEHEFTMDEVEVIQNYLLSKAGDDTDVILGLGYDNSLGNQIGITLIATGFSHRDPFSKENKIDKALENEKVVLQLEIPKQPSVAIPITTEIIKEQPIAEAVVEPLETKKSESFIFSKEEIVPDDMMPSLVDYNVVSNPVVEKEAEQSDEKIFFEISTSTDQIPTTIIDFQDFSVNANEEQKKTPSIILNTEENKDASNNSNLSSGGYLAKPSQIYAEEQSAKQESDTNDKLLTNQVSVQEDEPVIEMQLVVKETQNAAEEPVVQQTQPIMMSSIEEPALQDETEDLRRRAAERIAKLRNLSFNVNASDPNNEFETVPAYLRRNMDMPNQIADVESFYSAYTVKSNDNNQAEIGTINTFLDGKKPD